MGIVGIATQIGVAFLSKIRVYLLNISKLVSKCAQN